MTDRRLLIQNSTGTLCLGLSQGDDIIFDSTNDPSLATSRDMQAVAKQALDATGLRISDLTGISVDIGPGGLGATRSAVAFANALSFASNIPVQGLRAFDLIGRHAYILSHKPVMCIRPAARPNFYIGYYGKDGLERTDFTDKSTLLSLCAEHANSGVFAGKFSLKPESTTSPQSLTNLAPLSVMLATAQSSEISHGPVWPITESMWGANVG